MSQHCSYCGCDIDPYDKQSYTKQNGKLECRGCAFGNNKQLIENFWKGIKV